MIRFEPAPEPEDFDASCRKPGMRWLAENPQAPRPREYWLSFKPQLAFAFRQLCAYSAMYEPVGTIDHFVSFNEDRSLAYEWTNYRYASHWINSSKQDAKVLDPFEVEDDWFEILLPSLQLVLTDRVSKQQRGPAEHTLARLNLRDDERVIGSDASGIECIRPVSSRLKGYEKWRRSSLER